MSDKRYKPTNILEEIDKRARMCSMFEMRSVLDYLE